MTSQDCVEAPGICYCMCRLLLWAATHTVINLFLPVSAFTRDITCQVMFSFVCFVLLFCFWSISLNKGCDPWYWSSNQTHFVPNTEGILGRFYSHLLKCLAFLHRLYIEKKDCIYLLKLNIYCSFKSGFIYFFICLFIITNNRFRH